MNSKESSFFSSVAKYNHERFHSEVITWCLNFNKEFALNFINKIAGFEIEQITNIEAICETENIDIRLNFLYAKDCYSIFIENKVKASEHFIKGEKLKVELSTNNKDLFDKIKNENLYQTEYYFLRNHLDKSKKIIYVFLKPLIVQPFPNAPDYIIQKKFNAWKILNKYEIHNPWITMSYHQLANLMPLDKINEDANSLIYNSYKNYLLDDFPNEELDASDENFYSQNVYSKYEYFKILNYQLDKKCSVIFGNILTNEVKSGSSNSSDPLFIFSLKINTPIEIKSYFEKSKFNEFLNIGIQLQGNSLKYFIEAFDYKNGIIKKERKKEFSAFCHQIISTHLENNIENNKKTFSKTKSFNTISEEIKLAALDETIEIIFNKISPFLQSIIKAYK